MNKKTNSLYFNCEVWIFFKKNLWYCNFGCVFRGERMSSRSSRTIYVGNLPGDIRMREIEDLFMKVSFKKYIYYYIYILVFLSQNYIEIYFLSASVFLID